MRAWPRHPQTDRVSLLDATRMRIVVGSGRTGPKPIAASASNAVNPSRTGVAACPMLPDVPLCVRPCRGFIMPPCQRCRRSKGHPMGRCRNPGRRRPRYTPLRTRQTSLATLSNACAWLIFHAPVKTSSKAFSSPAIKPVRACRPSVAAVGEKFGKAAAPRVWTVFSASARRPIRDGV